MTEPTTHDADAVFHISRTPIGFEMWGKWTFVDIVAPKKLSMTVGFSDAQGCNGSVAQLGDYLAQLSRP